MCYYVGIEDLAANALIALIESGKREEITFAEIREYGQAVVELLKDESYSAVLILSRERTNTFEVDCSDYFEVVEDNAIKLRTGKTPEDLRRVFRAHTSFPVLKACLDQNCLQVIGIGC